MSCEVTDPEFLTFGSFFFSIFYNSSENTALKLKEKDQAFFSGLVSICLAKSPTFLKPAILN